MQKKKETNRTETNKKYMDTDEITDKIEQCAE